MTKSHKLLFSKHHPRSSNIALPTHNPKHPQSLLSMLQSHPILKSHHIHIDIPQNRLIPMPNNRLTYLQWVRELLEVRLGKDYVRECEIDALASIRKGASEALAQPRDRDQHHPDHSRHLPEGKPPHATQDACHKDHKYLFKDANSTNKTPPHRKIITGIDIGTGSSAIYPLLGLHQFGWHFLATECDKISYESACKNVYETNHIEREQIDVRLVDRDAPLLECLDHILERDSCTKEDGATKKHFHFTVCNPPFFESEAHAQGSQNPQKVCPGSASELWCAGGEYKFLTRLVDDSLRLRNRVGLYTSWVGRKSTLKRLKQFLYARRIFTQYHTEFLEGLQYRWGIAWVVPEDHSLTHSPEVQEPQKSPPKQHVTRHFAIHRRMRHTLKQSLKDLHTQISEIIRLLEKNKEVSQVEHDKYTGIFSFHISMSPHTDTVKVTISFKSLSPSQTLCQIECVDFHDLAYQRVYNKICEAILDIK
mmetsp:Transcript_1556/g.5346  ORF Transcript_1556/g.5346 Transcript_1556/m.5346 type:complete len:479 (-) Transcript_1556:2670-4106(-)